MSLAFSRRSFLKYSAVAAVAVAGASLFSGCDQTDTKNLYCDGAGSITVLQINAVLGTYDNDAKKYKDIDLTGASISFPFQITVGRTNNLPIQPSNFKAIVYGKDGKQRQSMLVEPAASFDRCFPAGHQPGKQRYQLRQDYAQCLSG